MKKKCSKINFILLTLLLTVAIHSQDFNNKWAISIGAGGTLYQQDDLQSIGYRYSEQFPRISVSRYLFKSITFAGTFSTSFDSEKKYTTFDGELRYDFGTSQNLVNVYALVGGSLVDTKYLLPVLNFGFGGTLWFSNSFGINSQMVYKNNHLGFKSQASHIFGSGSIIYRFNFGNSNRANKSSRKRKGSKRTRLWEMNH